MVQARSRTNASRAKPPSAKGKPAAAPSKKPTSTKAAPKSAPKATSKAAPKAKSTKPNAAQKRAQRTRELNAALATAVSAAVANDARSTRAALAEAVALAHDTATRTRVQEGCQNSGNCFVRRQQWAEVAAIFDLGTAAWKKGDDTRLTAEMASEAGFALTQLKQLDAAEARLERALELHTRGERPIGIATALYYLSSVAFERVQMDRAVELGRRAVATSRAAGDQRMVAFHSYALARALYEQGHSREAEQVATEAIAIASQFSATAIEGNLANTLANVALDDHRLVEAEAHYLRARECFKACDLKLHEAITYANLGNLAANQASYDDALERYQTALAHYAEFGEHRLAAIALTARAAVYAELARFDEAHADLETALATMTRAGHERRVSFVRAGFAKLAEARGELTEARAHFAETEIALEAAGDTVEMGRMLYAAAGVEADLGDPEAAEALLERAASLDPASLSPDATGRGEKRAGMDAVRVLRDLAIGRIEMAKARRAAPDEARAFRAAAAGRLAQIDKATDSLIDRSMEVRRVADRLRAQLEAS